MESATNVRYETINQVLNVMDAAKGHKVKEFDVDKRLEQSGNKGSVGQIVEHGILGIVNNSREEPDIPNLNLEVKATGVRNLNSKNIRAKERLALETLNYKKVAETEFEDSNLWKKCQKLLLVFYEYINNVSYGDFYIDKSIVYDFASKDCARDLEIIKRDYNIIRDKILAGRAEDISEGDTMYLGACTAGTGAFVPQYNSDVKVKQRKFCLKVGYMNSLVRKFYLEVQYANNPLIKEIKEDTFEIEITQRLKPYYGWSEDKIREYFNLDISIDAKNRYERYIAKMLGYKESINNSEEFIKSNMKTKTIRVQKNGTIKESMSFPAFDFEDIYDQNWEDSDIREMFSSAKFMFVIFKETDKGMIFDHIKFWNMSEDELDDKVKPIYNELKDVISTGNIYAGTTTDKNGKEIWLNNFPHMANGKIVHVRPHGKNKNDTCKLPVPDRTLGLTEYTKQCFWLSHNYVKKIINEDQ